MSLNILLIDDEYVVLKGLEAMLLSQKELDLCITLSIDAIDAMSKIPYCQPDVIISDINLPEIDGLTMIEKIIEQNCLCKFIIISGFENMEYLKKAIKLQVVDYLLKPIDKIHLIKKLTEIQQEKNEHIQILLLKFKMLFIHGEYTEYCSITDEEMHVIFPYANFAFCVSMIPSHFANSEIRKALLEYFENVYFFSQGNQSIFLLNFATPLKSSEIRYIWNLCAPDCSVGLSVIINKLQLNAFTNQTGSQIYSQALIDLVLNILPVSFELKQITQELINLPNDTISLASKVLQNDCPLQLYIETLFHSGHSMQEIHLQAFIEIFVCYFSIIGINMAEKDIIHIYQKQAAQINSNQSLTTFLQDMLVNFWNTMPYQLNHSNQSDKIQIVCTYIKQHYTDDLSLDLLAEKVHLNPCYLSYIFKKETGITFLQYLHQNRIMKACTLLKKNSGQSIESIAAQVGYRSATYFHKIFRSQLGMSPKQWISQNEKL